MTTVEQAVLVRRDAAHLVTRCTTHPPIQVHGCGLWRGGIPGRCRWQSFYRLPVWALNNTAGNAA
jgi:hypothetical protein